MSEVQPQMYLVRDPQGNVYGPADAGTLREWVGQGRIVAGMHIAPRETREWVEVSQHPVLTDLFNGPATVTAGVASDQPTTPAATPTVTPTPAAAQPVSPVNTLRNPGTISTMQYETPIAKRNPLSRISMIFGIASSCVTILGCVPFCGCIAFPLGSLGGLAAIIMGIVAIVQARGLPDEGVAKRESLIGIILGGVALFLMSALMTIGFLLRFHRGP